MKKLIVIFILAIIGNVHGQTLRLVDEVNCRQTQNASAQDGQFAVMPCPLADTGDILLRYDLGRVFYNGDEVRLKIGAIIPGGTNLMVCIAYWEGYGNNSHRGVVGTLRDWTFATLVRIDFGADTVYDYRFRVWVDSTRYLILLRQYTKSNYTMMNGRLVGGFPALQNGLDAFIDYVRLIPVPVAPPYFVRINRWNVLLKDGKKYIK